MDGYERDFINRMLGINGHITIINPPNTKRLLTDIKNISSVNFAAEVAFGNGILSGNKSSKGAFIRCMELEDILQKP